MKHTGISALTMQHNQGESSCDSWSIRSDILLQTQGSISTTEQGSDKTTFTRLLSTVSRNMRPNPEKGTTERKKKVLLR